MTGVELGLAWLWIKLWPLLKARDQIGKDTSHQGKKGRTKKNVTEGRGLYQKDNTQQQLSSPPGAA